MTYPEFKARYALTPDPQQEAAILRAEGPTLLLAVPGSGKTTTLVTRLGYLIHCLGVEPGRILTVTYTVAAAGDMKRRFAALFGEEHAGALAFRTINGICQSIISYYAWAKGAEPFVLWTNEGELNALVRWLMQSHGAEWPGEQEVKEVRTRITCCKNGMLRDEEVRAIEMDGVDFPAVYFGYREYLERNRRMDYDDQMVFALRILRRYPDILAHFQSKYPYLCVDEAQDTSKIQHAILRLLAARSRNLFMVGDEDQSIYGFRAAWPQALMEFRQIYPEGEVLLMETNYRSAGAIVEKADAFIQRNGSRHPKHMRASRPQGEPVRHVNLNDFGQQAHYLAQAAADCTESTAVLYRNNDSALPLIDLLERRGIPYACRQRESFFFTSPAVRDLTDVLRFALDGTDRERFLRIYYKLEVRVKRSVLQEKLRRGPEGAPVLDALIDGGGFEPWQTGRLKALRTHLSKLPQLSSFVALQRIVKYMGYGDYLSSQGGDKSRVELLLALARQEPGVEGFLCRLEALRDTVEAGGGDPACPFVLSTIHASKGLEYDRVFLIDAVDGIFPSVNPRKGNDLSDEERAALEEERRLFYVGATRARRQLVLLTCDNRFGEPSPPASFVGQFLGTPEWASQRPRTPGKAPAEPDAAAVAAWEKDYLPGTAVVHRAFGPGMVVSRSGAVAVIAFDEVGTKKVELTACLRKRLLRLASAPGF